ncbi:hypothetical protein [Gynuella sp.]|uniref:hypothetical protein n=1 Tax=Gynuella sp. TaxID=2969146 RepID=UPI003D12F9B8
MSKQHAEVFDDVKQMVAMNPNLTLDELNAVMQLKVEERNNRPNPDFCGLSPTQMFNWLYKPMDELNWVTICTPEDFSSSPVMRYLTLILDEAMQNDGSFKATSKGNLPAKLVKQASELLPEFAIATYERDISLSEFAGSNEDKFNALHYTRILAEIAGIIYRRSGRYHVKKTAQKHYQSQGIRAFFKPMLEAAVTKYNWSYLDGYEQDVDLRPICLFMVWRLQSHASVDQLVDEVERAFPDLLQQVAPDNHYPPENRLDILIESRFVNHFLEFWGFIIVDPKRYDHGEAIARKAQLQPLFTQTFQFDIQPQ